MLSTGPTPSSSYYNILNSHLGISLPAKNETHKEGTSAVKEVYQYHPCPRIPRTRPYPLSRAFLVIDLTSDYECSLGPVIDNKERMAFEGIDEEDAAGPDNETEDQIIIQDSKVDNK